MKLYIKRLGNSEPKNVSTTPNGPWYILPDGYLALIATPAQIYEVNKLVDDTRNNPVVEVDVEEELWNKIKKAING